MISQFMPSWSGKWLQQVDAVLLAAISLLAFLGLTTLYSAGDENVYQVYRQGAYFLAGLALIVVFSQIQSKTLRHWAVWLYAAAVFLLVLVLLVGEIKKGAQRWLFVGVDIQPAEIMKLAMPMMLAYFFADKQLPPRFTDILVALALIGVPVLLIALQPDLGSAVLVALSGLFVVYLAGMSWWLIGGGIAAVSVAAPLLFFYGMREYQQQRVLTLLNPGEAKLTTGYHIYQSMIAIGSGGVYGKGWLHGDQSHLGFVPERHTDFIFAVFGEEFGLVGNLVLMGLYLFIIWRGLYLATQGEDTFARLLGGSLSMTFFVYLFVNSGMVVGILPVVGVPLPLVSYGGTSVVTLLMAFGMVMGMRKRKRVYRQDD